MGKFSGKDHAQHEIDNRSRQLNPEDLEHARYRENKQLEDFEDFDNDNINSSESGTSIKKEENNKPSYFEDKINKLSNIKRGVKMEFIKINKGTYVSDGPYYVEIVKDIYLNINSLTTFQFYKPDKDLIYSRNNQIIKTFEKDKYNIFEITFTGIYGFPESNSNPTIILIPVDDESQNKIIKTLIECIENK